MIRRARVRRPIFGLGLAALAATLMVGFPADASAQLISPGKLSRAHENLEGIRNCTQCHQLGNRGSDDDKCLACHIPLQEQLGRGEGLHATYDEPSCASCHKEHFGVDFDVLHFDHLAFEHPTTGFDLVGAHASLRCQTCHTASLVHDPALAAFQIEHNTSGETFLGLGTECLDCHNADDPHDGQFADRACTSCHDQEAWTPVPGFDHADTRFPLTGRHGSVTCEQCHLPSTNSAGGTSVRYSDAEFSSCLSCHDDYHGGSMGDDCTQCHSTSSWTGIAASFEGGFDHETTGFSLLGAHGSAACTDCHGSPAARPAGIALAFVSGTERASYPQPNVESESDCLACHIDEHDGRFQEAPGGAICSSCHSDDLWLPAAFDNVRHDTDTDFPLTGAHRVTPCVGCHTEPGHGRVAMEFTIDDTTCRDCHAASDPHQDQFTEACESCHVTDTFNSVSFDHNQSRFVLDGAHQDLDCGACHGTEQAPDGRFFTRYKPLAFECSDCHAGAE